VRNTCAYAIPRFLENQGWEGEEGGIIGDLADENEDQEVNPEKVHFSPNAVHHESEGARWLALGFSFIGLPFCECPRHG